MIKSLLTLGLRWPRATVLVIGALVAVAGALVLFGPLGVSTSRTGLVSLKSPYQARLFRYYETFGRSQFAAMVISGGTAENERAFVDRFEAELAKFPEFHGRVLGKVALEDVAETLFVWQPELARFLPLLEKGLRPGEDPWVSLLHAAERRVSSELGAAPDAEPAPNGDTPAPNPKHSIAEHSAELGRLADGIAALRHALATDGRLAIGQLGVGQGGSQVDDHGYLTGAGGRYHLVLIFPALQSDEGRELKPVVDTIRGARDRAVATLPGSGVQADLTGAPALAVDELASLQQGSQVTSVLSTAGIFILLMGVFRNLRHVAVALVPMLASMVLTLGFVFILYRGLNLVTSSFMSVLLGLGIDFSVHLLWR
ncbi:MAG TPA: MMPL family transporter, partial [Polyangiaceae bacterium]|nr:MMPL family transporter [Polyangiaceae bacterium]